MLAGLLVPVSSHALSPDRRLTQLHHTAWTLEAGAPPDIWALAQAADGFLWLGTGEGLYRFDGLGFEAMRPAGDRMSSHNITALLAARDGSLWAGSYAGEVSRLKGGRLETFGAPAKGSVQQLAEGANGTLWAALGSTPDGGLARFDGRQWSQLGADWGVPAGAIYSVLAARDGTVWAAAETQILVLRPGEHRFRAVPGLRPRARLSQAPDGRVWYSGGRQGLARDVEDEPALLPLPSGVVGPLTDRSVFDRNGALWESSTDGGIVRIVSPGAAPRIERFAAGQGLTSDVAVPVLEDREGDIWVGTNLGLDRFRAVSAVVALGLPETVRGGFEAAAGPDGAIFIAAGRTLQRIDRDGSAIVVAQLPAGATLLQARADGTLAIGIPGGLLTLGPKGLRPASGPPIGEAGICSWAQDASGTEWITANGVGVFFRSRGAWQRFSADGGKTSGATLHTISGPGGGTWFYARDRVYRRSGERLSSFGTAEGLNVGVVNIISVFGDEILVGGDEGIAKYAAGRFDTISADRVPALTRVTGLAVTDGAVWVNSIKGAMRIAEPDLAAALATPAGKLRYDLFDVTDGLPGVAQQDHGTQTAIVDAGKRVWLVQSHGVASVDPARLARNAVAPLVTIQSASTRERQYALPRILTLPAGTSSLQVDYAALSLSKPEQVAFRYRLEGLEDDWVDAGARRQAFYTKLGSGHYVFHVIARNSDGVWNTAGATVAVVIPPTFAQSALFLLLCGLAAFALMWLTWSLRMRTAARRINDRFEARLAERERIARELHDTLLQGFGGLMLRFQAAAAGIAPGHASRRKLEDAMALADTVLREGRSRLVDLRETDLPRDVPQSFAATAERLSLAPRTRMRVTVEGESRPLHPAVADEVAKIGEEAIANVQRHAAAQQLDASVVYGERELRVCFWDDGVGIDADVLRQGGRSEHYGLRGMRERAERIRGRLTVRSAPSFGTTIELSVPASVAYASASLRRMAGGSL